MHRVIATKGVSIGESAGFARERGIDTNQADRGERSFKISDRSTQPTDVDAFGPRRRGQRCPRLRVDEVTGDTQL